MKNTFMQSPVIVLQRKKIQLGQLESCIVKHAYEKAFYA